MMTRHDNANAPGHPGGLEAYELGEPLVRGDVGTVYAGRDPVDGAPVTVKVGHHGVTELRLDPARLDDLTHPQVVSLRDAGQTELGEWVLVQDAPTGPSLAEAAAHFEGRYRDIALFMRETARTLADVHAIGVTHGDISMRTLHLGASDEAVLSELGMGMVTGALGGEAPLAGAAGPGVDPAGRMERKFKLDERADIFALGAVLYELLSGQKPTARPLALLSDPHAPTDDIPAIDRVAPEAPPELRAICAQALSTDPVHRYLHAETLVRDLDAYLHGKRSKPAVKIVFALVAILTVGLFGLWGAIGGGPARIIDVRLDVLRADAPEQAAETLVAGLAAMGPGDHFRIRATLCKEAHLSVYYREPSGRVVRLTGGADDSDARRAHDLPTTTGGDGKGWTATGRGGLGVLIVVSHTRAALPDGWVDGVMVGLGDPPRGFSSIAWWGTSLPAPVTPSGREGGDAGRQERWSSLEDYAEQAVKGILPEADDVVVGVLYVIGA